MSSPCAGRLHVVVSAVVVFLRDDLEVRRWPLDLPAAGVDFTTVDHLARLQLTARRLGGEIRLTAVSPRLRELLDLAGLGDWVEVQR